MRSFAGIRVTTDALVRRGDQVLLVRRKYPPPGWALPGGFLELGESLEDAVLRELEEETGLKGRILRQLHTYSDPARDPRGHTVTTVFLVAVHRSSKPRAADDAAGVSFFPLNRLPRPMAFDHGKIVRDYHAGRI